MKFEFERDEGFGSVWRFTWGWLPDRLDPVRGSLALADNVGEALSQAIGNKESGDE